ncbi:MAG: hypothetical protein AB7S26_39685 [Sandaracinaceae bacterium]
MGTLAEQLGSWRDGRTQTARGFVQVAWACIRTSTEPDEAVDAALGTLARVELARVDALDEGHASFGFDTPFGAFTWQVTPDAPQVDRLVVLLGAFATRDANVLDRAAAWSLSPDVRRPRDAGWFTPSLIDLVLAATTGRDTGALQRTARRILPSSHHAFIDFVVGNERAALAPKVRALGPSWALAARLFRTKVSLSDAGRATYVARRDALDADPEALVTRLDAFPYAPSEEVLGALFEEADQLGLTRTAVAPYALDAFLARSNAAIPASLGGAVRGVPWTALVSALDARPDDGRLDALFVGATPTREEAEAMLARASAPHRARTQALVALERWAEVLTHATRDEVHARATAFIATGAPREALAALARHDDVDALALRRRALVALGEPTLPTSAALATRTHPHDPPRALLQLAELEPDVPEATRAAATRPTFVSLAWVRALREAGAEEHARSLASALRLDELLGARNEDPELLFVALEQACRPSAPRHPLAPSPMSELRRVLDTIGRTSPGAHPRVAQIATSVTDPALREALDAWVATAIANAASTSAPEPPRATESAEKRDDTTIAPGVVLRKRRR